LIEKTDQHIEKPESGRIVLKFNKQIMQ